MAKEIINLKHKNQKEILELKNNYFMKQKDKQSDMTKKLWEMKNAYVDKTHSQQLERLEFAHKLKKK